MSAFSWSTYVSYKLATNNISIQARGEQQLSSIIALIPFHLILGIRLFTS